MRLTNRLLPLVNAAMCVILLVLLVVDAIWPLANIFLNQFVKVYLLLTGLTSAACGMMLISRQRRRARRPRWMR